MSSAANLTDKNENLNIIEIGGAFAGLTVTTTFLARAGKSVTLFEQSTKEIGRRAKTSSSVRDGFYFNQGEHMRSISLMQGLRFYGSLSSKPLGTII
jgi:phytoene dehydrogenase-like protein